MTEQELKLFWDKVGRDGPVVREELGKCWVWTKSKRNGYGAFSIKRKAQQAHRLSYELQYGKIPEGLLVRHKCDNRACVRPDHLELGTHMQNMNDMLLRNDNIHVLAESQVREARLRAKNGDSIYSIQKDLKVDRSALMRAVQGKTFKWLAEPAPVELDEIYRPVYSKLTEQNYTEILEALKKPYRGQGKFLAKKYGVDPSMITLIKQGKLKSIDVS